PKDLREIEVFADDADARLLLNLSCEAAIDQPEKLGDLLRAGIPGLETILLHSRRTDEFTLSGSGYLPYRVGSHSYRVGHLSFFQVNLHLLEELVSVVLGDARGALALDLFAGVGLFAVPLAALFQRVIAVESNAAAVRDLEANLHDCGAASAAARSSPVEAFL